MSDELPKVPPAGSGLDEETAPPIVDAPSAAVPVMRSLNDLSAAEDASSSPQVQFAQKPATNPKTSGLATMPVSLDKVAQAAKPAGVDTAPVSLDAVAQSTDSIQPVSVSTSSSFDEILNPRSGSHDQLPSASASGSFDRLGPPVSSTYGQVAPKTKRADDDRPPLAISAQLGITVAVGLLCVLVVTWICVSQWVPSQNALLLMGGGMALPTLLAGYFTSQRSSKNIVVRLLPALILAAGGMAVAVSWSQPHVRALAVPYTPASVKGMKQMLGDSSHEIALAACNRFTPHHQDPDWWGPMFDLLNQRPSLALECISTMPDEAKTRIGGALADRWSGELVKGQELEPARACVIASGVSTLPVPPQEAAARLLQCSVESEVEGVQRCCAEALAGMVEDPNDWASRLPAVLSTAKDANVRSGVLAMSLHGQGLTEPQQELASEIGFDSPVVRHVTLVLACESVTNEASDAVQHLKAALDTHCSLEMDRMPKGSQWPKLCRNSLERLKANPTTDPVDVLCQLTTVKPIAEAIAEAQKVVRTAPPIITK